MGKTKRLIIGLAAAIMVFSTASCQKDDTIRYNNLTMGNVVNKVFISDQGNRFNVTEQLCPGKLDTMKRAFIMCDVLAQTGENEYDIRLNYMASVLEKNAVSKNDIEDFEAYTNDPIILSDNWISAGYLNLFITVPIKSGSKTQHEINLVHELVGDVHKFYIRHNANGEVLKEDGDKTQWVFASAYASFPISSIINADKAELDIEFNTYRINGSAVSSQTETAHINKEYEKSTFEHVPTTPVSSASVLNIQ